MSIRTPIHLMTSHQVVSQKMTNNLIVILQTQKMMPKKRSQSQSQTQTQTMILILSQTMILIQTQTMILIQTQTMTQMKATSPQTVIQSSQKSQPSQPRSQLSQPLIRTDRIYVLPNMTQSR